MRPGRYEEATYRHSLCHAETEVNCPGTHAAAVAPVPGRQAGRGAAGPPHLPLHRGRRRLVSAGQADSERAVPRGNTGRTRWFTCMPRCRSRCRCSCRSTRAPSPRVGGRLVTVATLLFFGLERRCCSGTRSGSTRSDAAGHLLRLGQLLRDHRAGAGVELRQLALRHAPGEAAVRSDRRRRVVRRDHRRRAGALPGRTGRRRGQHAAGAGGAHHPGRGDRFDCQHAAPAQAGDAPSAAEPGADSRCGAPDRGEPVPPADGRPGLSRGDRDAVDGVSAEPRGRRAVRRRRHRPDAILRHVQFHAGHRQLPPAAARDRPGAAPFGIAVTVLVLPIALGFGTAIIWLVPGCGRCS